MCAVCGSRYLLLTFSAIAVGMGLKYAFPLLQGLIHIIRVLIGSSSGVALMNRTTLEDSALSLKVLLNWL